MITSSSSPYHRLPRVGVVPRDVGDLTFPRTGLQTPLSLTPEGVALMGAAPEEGAGRSRGREGQTVERQRRAPRWPGLEAAAAW